MKRPTINFTDQMYQKLAQRIQDKGLSSISECVLELVDLGLRVEEAAAKQNEKTDEVNLLSELAVLKKLLKQNSVWSLEARLLARFLVYPNDDLTNTADRLKQYKM